MITRENLIYSASAAARILGIIYGQSRIVVREWFSVIWVWVPGHRPRFMSKAVFKHHFVERRKAAARALRVTQHIMNPTAFTVRNEDKGSTYTVQTIPTGLVCECEDYCNQVQFLGQGCCKHNYAVLNHLGFKSLSSYLNATKASTPTSVLAA
ncbi:MAG: hypothetical protein KME35_19485 [Aphanocapsa sp. GSE-SYN-MK-11-07L]|jgi:hypothetical protein|nr:hypothetical protein [Aphanocapsa sp. GSE-SYN-MK-11-07L]